MNKRTYTLDVGGKHMTATISDLVDQAGGAVMLECENTVVLATACMSKDGKGNPGYFNLTVEYQERFYAAGVILGGQYNKREGRPSDEAILSSRIIDRTIRPLFPSGIKNAVQVVATVLSVGSVDPGVLAVNACSLALGLSHIPWAGPVGAVLVSKPKGQDLIATNLYVKNTGETGYDLDMTVCGKDGKIVMIEALAYEYDETTIGDWLDRALVEITELENWQKGIIEKEGKTKVIFEKKQLGEETKTLFENTIAPKLQTLWGGIGESKARIAALEDEWTKLLDAHVSKENDEEKSLAKEYLDHAIDKAVHDGGLNENKRVDGRRFDEVRSLFAQAGGFTPIVHGVGTFYRGQTHVMSFLTLGGPEAAQEIEGMEVRGTKRFSHHYNFPPFSVGETGRFGGINRREMGHGFLAEKALTPVIPDKTTFPYTIRVVSECMASNGSTSQASICASTLALMDGGVPITRPVAGIAMGLLLDAQNESNYKILTDIQGPEDHHGDMDFKVAGTREGVTALQLDIKVGGIPPRILKEALQNAKNARLEILTVIEQEIATPRKDISPNAPKILVTKINPEKIGLVIGSGGKTIKGIKEATGAEITIEDDGTVYCVGSGGSAEKALAIVEGMTHEWVIGEQFTAKVIKIIEVGAIVGFGHNSEGLVHISEIAPFRIAKVTDVLKEGQEVPVKIISIDSERGRISLSIKEADKDFIKKPESY